MPVPSTKDSLNRLSAKERIYSTIRDWIIEGVLEPNEKLSDVELSEYFSVSRTPVREAFQLLAAQKLVRVLPGKATIVADIKPDNLREWYLPLAHLQALAAELACQRLDDKQIDELELLNQRFAQTIRTGEIAASLKADAAFHRKILDLAGNQYITEFSETLLLHVQRIEYAFFRQAKGLEQSVRAHADLIAALRRRDAQAAGFLMKNNWLLTMERFEQELADKKV